MEIDTINTYYVEGTKGDSERALIKIRNVRKQILNLLYNGVDENDVPNTLKSIDSIGVAQKLNFKIKTELILYAVGDMTIPISKRHDEMRDEYLEKYPTKKEAQKRFLKDYYALHKPFDKIKTLCWKTLFFLEGLDENGEELRGDKKYIFN